MITHISNDILKSTALALVNPVNCVGIAGSGLALQFKKKFPRYFKDVKPRIERALGDLNALALVYGPMKTKGDAQ